MQFAKSKARFPGGNSGMAGFRKVSLAFVCVAGTASAHAYIDPGSGYLLFQAIAAVIAAVGTTIGLYWRKFKGLLHRMTGRAHEESPEGVAAEAQGPDSSGAGGGNKGAES